MLSALISHSDISTFRHPCWVRCSLTPMVALTPPPVRTVGPPSMLKTHQSVSLNPGDGLLAELNIMSSTFTSHHTKRSVYKSTDFRSFKVFGGFLGLYDRDRGRLERRERGDDMQQMTVGRIRTRLFKV